MNTLTNMKKAFAAISVVIILIFVDIAFQMVYVRLRSCHDPGEQRTSLNKKRTSHKKFVAYNDREIPQDELRFIPSEAEPTVTDRATATKNRFLQRKQHASQICQKLSKSFIAAANTAPQPETFANGFFRWCRVRKAASSFMIEFDNQVIMQSSKNNSERLKYNLTLVREPYSRLISGYIDRIVTFQGTWARYGWKIVQKFRLGPVAPKKPPCGHDVTFPEFIKFFIDSHENKSWEKDYHFVPMHEQCSPCVNSFDYICHLETMRDDISYVLSLLNVTINEKIGDTMTLIKGKAKSQIKQKKVIKGCQSMCDGLRTFWWSLKARALIANDMVFPLHEPECDTVTEDQFADICWKAHLQSVNRIDKARVTRQTMVDLFSQVSLDDRLKVKDILFLDFQLFGYEPQPDDLFPELAKK